MFVRERTVGLIFQKKEFREADQIISVFSQDFGRIEVLCKGIRKIASKLKYGIEIFYLSEIETVKGYYSRILTDVQVVEKFSQIRKNLARLSIAYQISEVLDGLIKESEREEKIWNLLLNTFSILNNQNLNLTICHLSFYYFFWNLVNVLGFGPRLKNCVFCQKRILNHLIYFSAEDGGVVCKECFLTQKKGERVSQRLIKFLRAFLEFEFDLIKKVKVKKSDFAEMKTITKRYFQNLIEKHYASSNSNF